jgi:hypothetical protein
MPVWPQELPDEHEYPGEQPLVLRSVHDIEQALPPAHGKPLHDLFLTVEHEPAALQYWVVRLPLEQVDELHATELSGYVQAALEPLQ